MCAFCFAITFLDACCCRKVMTLKRKVIQAKGFVESLENTRFFCTSFHVVKRMSIEAKYRYRNLNKTGLDFA